MLLKQNGGGDFAPAPIGSHVARCIGLIDLGTQSSEYQGKPIIRRQIVVRWELPNELMTEGEWKGKPFMVSKFYTASLSEKATLRADLVNWRGRDFSQEELMGFDSKNILDKPCMVSVVHNDKGKAKVAGVMALPKGTTCPPRVNDLVFFSLERDEFKAETLEKLGDFYKGMIQQAPEYHKLFQRADPVQQRGSQFDDLADDIPF